MPRGANGGRPAKPQRRNRAPRRVDFDMLALPVQGRQGRVPQPSVALPDQALKLWRQMWRGPAATMWTVDDVPALTRLVALSADPATWTNPRLLAELRQLEDRFGLSPWARRAMRWSVEESAADVAAAPDVEARIVRLRERLERGA